MGKRCNAADRPKRYLPFGLGRNRAIWRPSRLHGQPAHAARHWPPTHPDCGPTRAIWDHEQVLRPWHWAFKARVEFHTWASL